MNMLFVLIAASAVTIASRPPKLEDVLQISLIQKFPSWLSCNTILLSKNDTTAPAFNTLYLNMLNTGATPLYVGKTMWGDPTPRITLSFSLGDGVNDLTCMYPTRTDAECPITPDGESSASAWNIVPGIDVDYTGGWHIAGSGPIDPTPVFTLMPQNTNREIIGACHAPTTCDNVTFSFSKIVAYTPPGVTQVKLRLQGFPYNESNFYDDATITVNVIKKHGSAGACNNLTAEGSR
jgi:hypothetical protein